MRFMLTVEGVQINLICLVILLLQVVQSHCWCFLSIEGSLQGALGSDVHGVHVPFRAPAPAPGLPMNFATTTFSIVPAIVSLTVIILKVICYQEE